MKKRNKALLLTFSAVSLAAASVLGTIAYFTATETVTNTFTVGKVAITLDEAPVGTDGKEIPDAPRVKANQYKLMPGGTYDKDPIIHVAADSEDCWVFVTVDNGIGDIEAWAGESGYKPIKDQMTDNGWMKLCTENNQEVQLGNVAVYAYESKVAKDEGDKELEVFETFKIRGEGVESAPENPEDRVEGSYYIEEYAESSIAVNAYAVQAEGFVTALEAWEATFGQ